MPKPEVRLRDPNTCVLRTLGDLKPRSLPGERTWQWATPQIEGVNPCARGGHTATLVTGNNGASARVIVFGGHYNGDNDEGYIYLNDVFILDVDENTWITPHTRGTPPESRYGHSASLVGSRIVYFGGRGENKKHFRDLHALDITTLTWYQGPSSGGAPAARMGHTSTLYGTNLFIFGGVCGSKYFGGLHVLDLSSMAWRAQDTTGPGPTARMGHTAVLLDHNLVVHGGFSLPPGLDKTEEIGDVLNSCYLSDFRVLDLENYQWSRLRTHGTPLSARFGHSLVVTGTDLVAFGGWNGQDKTNWATRGKEKAEEAAAGGTQADTLQSSGDCMSLRTSDMTWSQVKYSGQAPSSRYFHSCTTIGPHLIIFGGYDGGKPLADLVVLRETSDAPE